MRTAPDLTRLYAVMLRCRLFEEATAQLWADGHISGEMHLGMGEEGIVAGVADHLVEGDALALDHRGTGALLSRGSDPVALLRELLGRPDGLCRGMGGHMHLFDRDRLACSSGIVGASAPAAVGFGLAGALRRPGSVAVAFFGEGAMNQGMVMEAFNLAVVWRLPVLFVCKDDGWAITTPSRSVTAGSPAERARSFGLAAAEVDGWRVEEVWEAAGSMVDQARGGGGPSFLRARCVHLEGHFLGDPLLSVARRPVSELAEMAGPMLSSALAGKGTPLRGRIGAVRSLAGSILQSRRDRTDEARDPLVVARRRLESESIPVDPIEQPVAAEVKAVLEAVLRDVNQPQRA